MYKGYEVYEHHRDECTHREYDSNTKFFNWFYDQQANIIGHWITNGGDEHDKDGIIEFAKEVYKDFIDS